MPEELRVEVLSFHEPDELALAAARLLIAQIDNKYDPNYVIDDDVEEYVDEFDDPVATPYALVDSESGLVAAALVLHGGDDVTYIAGIAVDPRAQGSGYGRRLMHHIAAQALSRQDRVIRLKSMETPFFEHLGFTMLGDNYMEAAPSTVLSK